MTQNDSKWLKITKNDSKWLKKLKMTQSASNNSRWLEITKGDYSLKLHKCFNSQASKLSGSHVLLPSFNFVRALKIGWSLSPIFHANLWASQIGPSRERKKIQA